MPELLSRRYPAEAESVPAVRHAVGDALTAAGFTDGDVRFSIALAVTEATANAVRHAYPHDAQGQIEVRVDYTASHGVVITITDHGVGMDARIGPPGMGLGLSVMRMQTTRLGIESNSSGTTITLHFHTR